MIKTEYNVIGVMSGTSLDGIDIIYATFVLDTVWNFKIHAAKTLPYPRDWYHILKRLISVSKKELKQLDREYTIYLSQCINQFIEQNVITVIDVVCSHGHTALHQPENKLTYQIGNMPELSGLINQTVVCDFRVQDVQYGGQGAPLVPIGDLMLFNEFDFCLNLGGFANVSTETDSKRIAYDICPVNIVLNHYVYQMGFDFDDKGSLASKGNLNAVLLKQLNSLAFYKQDYPKSLGIEWVKNNVFPLIDSFQMDIKDILRTFVEHITIQISKMINKKNDATVLITGGGVFNEFLIERLESKTKNKIIIPDIDTIEYKEALIFGLLGVLKLRGEVNCLSSVTGAQVDHSSGKVFYP